MPVNAARADTFIQAATDEIDATLGVQFTLPIDFGAAGVDPSVELILKRLAVLLATGRLIMAQAVGAEDTTTHAYGTYLLREGRALLQAIDEGTTVLIGVSRRPEYATSGNGPSIVQEDSESAMDAFYGFATRGESFAWRPGV